MVTQDEVLTALKDVIDPEIGANVVDLGFIKDIRIEDNRVEVRMVLTMPRCPLIRYLVSQVEEKARTVAEGRTVDVHILDEPWTPPSLQPREPGA